MKIIRSSFKVEWDIPGAEVLKKIECAGRTAYKSEDNITNSSAEKFIAMIIELGHESVLEHHSVTVRVVCDRGVSHEIVRHRIASYTQESTRYCNYSKEKFGSEVTFVLPNALVGKPKNDENYIVWEQAMLNAESSYLRMLNAGSGAQVARSVLPNSLKTEIVMTMNIREWRHFFKLRTNKAAHPDMREIAIPMLQEFKNKMNALFDDITPN